MNILVLFPEEALVREEIDRLLSRFKMKFDDNYTFKWIVTNSWMSHYSELMPNFKLEILSSEYDSGLGGIEIRVNPKDKSYHVRPDDDQRVYHYWTLKAPALKKDRLELVYPTEFDVFEYPFVDSHIFNKLSSRKFGFVNFPYGSLYNDPGKGPINAFGFRIDGDVKALVDRDRKHLLVAVLGGSSTFSLFCEYEEMFPRLIEKKLNARFEKAPIPLSFSVLNFGMHDHVVMQEMITYIVYVLSLKPDFVITHSGHNDIWYGLLNDPFLVNHCEIIYQQHYEKWSHILHRPPSEPEPHKYPDELNLPQNVLKACVSRHDQFKELVEGLGAKFIWGLQPTIYSKPQRHPNEEKIMAYLEEGFRLNPSRRQLYERVKLLMEQLSRQLSSRETGFLDINKNFSEYGTEIELMWDEVHTSPAGDERIADQYSNWIESYINNQPR